MTGSSSRKGATPKRPRPPSGQQIDTQKEDDK
jgi:hypothetical protein